LYVVRGFKFKEFLCALSSSYGTCRTNKFVNVWCKILVFTRATLY